MTLSWIEKIIQYANEENVWATFYDKNTGSEIGNFTFGKRYHWWILYALAVASFLIRYV